MREIIRRFLPKKRIINMLVFGEVPKWSESQMMIVVPWMLVLSGAWWLWVLVGVNTEYWAGWLCRTQWLHHIRHEMTAVNTGAGNTLYSPRLALSSSLDIWIISSPVWLYKYTEYQPGGETDKHLSRQPQSSPVFSSLPAMFSSPFSFPGKAHWSSN